MSTMAPLVRLPILFAWAAAALAPLESAAAGPAAPTPAYRDPSAPAEVRAEDLLSRLTLDEKLVMLGGTGFTTQPISRLGLPAFIMSDGPVGARNSGPTTAYPAGIALAASWDAPLAGRIGAAIGRDCRARGVHILLGPGINLYREPLSGRNFEYFGEDPLLSGKTAAAYIRGVQSRGVAATVKHYALNNQEFNRHEVSSDADERTIRELYLRAFQIAIRDAGPKAAMCSYNPVNGVHASQNRWLNVDVLKGEFGFTGLLMSDWESCYDTAGMANGGLDLEMPTAKLYEPARVKALVDSGAVPVGAIDDKVRRQLRIAFEMHWLDRVQEDRSIPKDDPSSAAAALDAARAGLVLLKNSGGLLPLDPAKLRRIVLLGPNADHPVTGGGGSSWAQPFHAPSVAEAIRALLPQGVELAVIPWKAGALPDASALQGMKGADAAILCVGFDFPGVRPAGPDAGRAWGGPGILFVAPPEAEGEGGDRAYALPPGCAELIRTVASVNPRTVVVLNAGGSVETAPWIGGAAALVHAFYGGQGGATALAEVLFGRINPSGRLPFSWERRLEDCPAYGHFPTRDHPRSNDYREGLLMGYRGFDAKGVEPLFPFGFGLSYTRFELSRLRAEKAASGEIRLTVDVRNAGSRAGSEVVEVYAESGRPEAGRPPRELKAYGKIFLKPGQAESMVLSLNPADLATWDAAGHTWVPAAGKLTLRAGEHSRDLPLRVDLTL